MPRDVTYHEAAIAYNKGMGDRARELAKEVNHQDIRRWCRAIAKQHDEHIVKHERSLRFLRKQKQKNAKRRSKANDGPKPTPPPKRDEELSEAEKQAQFAAEQENPAPDSAIDPTDADTNGLSEDQANEKQETSV